MLPLLQRGIALSARFTFQNVRCAAFSNNHQIPPCFHLQERAYPLPRPLCPVQARRQRRAMTQRSTSGTPCSVVLRWSRPASTLASWWKPSWSEQVSRRKAEQLVAVVMRWIWGFSLNESAHALLQASVQRKASWCAPSSTPNPQISSFIGMHICSCCVWWGWQGSASSTRLSSASWARY